MGSKTIKKAKSFIGQVAKKEGVPAEHVNVIITEAYKEIKKGLSNMAAIRQYLPGLGDFVCKIMLVKDTIVDDERTLARYPTNKIAKERLPKCQGIIKEDIEERQRWKDKIGEKEIYKHFKKNNNDTQGETTEGMGE